MVRNQQRRTNIGLIPEDRMREAVRAIVEDKKPLRETAREYNIPKSTLQRYVIKSKNLNFDFESSEQDINISFKPNYDNRKIFTSEEEAMLSDYLQQAAKLHHGLPPAEARKLAYEYAKQLNKAPLSWQEKQCAGSDWLDGFMRRAGNISLRKPESTSLARSMGFNKPVVSEFYNKLFNIMDKHKLGPENIYNLDETGVTSVQTTGKVIATKGVKQVGQVTSAERGELVTLCCIVNALGNSVPPFFIFPRVNFRDTMLIGAPAGSDGAATTSGWMTSQVFLLVLKHFIKYSKSSSSNKTLIIMDNHETHISIEAINLAKDNGVILFTIPPHCSHRLQPLDKAIFGPFKHFYNEAVRAWLVSNPGKRVTIHHIAGLVGTAYPSAFSTANILSGFSSTGIFPFNRNVYREEDYVAASVTDLPLETSAVSSVSKNGTDASVNELPFEDSIAPTSQAGTEISITNSRFKDIAIPSTSQEGIEVDELVNHQEDNSPGNNENEVTMKKSGSAQSQPPTFSGVVISPETVRPLPKAEPLRKTKRSRKSKKSEVLTDTPVKERIENETLERLEKKNKVKKRMQKTTNEESKAKKQKHVKKLWEESSEEEEWVESESDSNFELEDLEDLDEDLGEINEGDFALVKVCGKKKGVYYYYVAEIMKKYESEYEVKYMKRILPGFSFIFDSEDTYTALLSDIERKLPKPTSVKGTERTKKHFIFPVNFECYNHINVK